MQQSPPLIPPGPRHFYEVADAVFEPHRRTKRGIAYAVPITLLEDPMTIAEGVPSHCHIVMAHPGGNEFCLD